MKNVTLYTKSQENININMMHHLFSSLDCPSLTRPVRLGLPPTLEATELTELMEELEGL